MSFLTLPQLRSSTCFVCRQYSEVLTRKALGQKPDTLSVYSYTDEDGFKESSQHGQFLNMTVLDNVAAEKEGDERSAKMPKLKASAMAELELASLELEEKERKTRLAKLEEETVPIDVQFLLRHILGAPILHFAVPSYGYSSIAKSYYQPDLTFTHSRIEDIQSRLLARWKEEHESRPADFTGLLPSEKEFAQYIIRGLLRMDDGSYYPRVHLGIFVHTVMMRLIDKKMNFDYVERVSMFVSGLQTVCRQTEAVLAETVTGGIRQSPHHSNPLVSSSLVSSVVARVTNSPNVEGPSDVVAGATTPSTSSTEAAPAASNKRKAVSTYFATTGSDRLFEALHRRFRLCIPFMETTMSATFGHRRTHVCHDTYHYDSFEDYYTEAPKMRLLFPDKTFDGVPFRRARYQKIADYKNATSDEAKAAKRIEEANQLEKVTKAYPLIGLETNLLDFVNLQIFDTTSWMYHKMMREWTPELAEGLSQAKDVPANVVKAFFKVSHLLTTPTDADHIPLTTATTLSATTVTIEELLEPVWDTLFLRQLAAICHYLKPISVTWAELDTKEKSAFEAWEKACRDRPFGTPAPQPPNKTGERPHSRASYELNRIISRLRHTAMCYILAYLVHRCIVDNRFHFVVQQLLTLFAWPRNIHMRHEINDIDLIHLTFRETEGFLKTMMPTNDSPPFAQVYRNLDYILANKVPFVVERFEENKLVRVPLYPDESMFVLFDPYLLPPLHLQ